MRIAHTVGKTPANLLYIMRQFINFNHDHRKPHKCNGEQNCAMHLGATDALRQHITGVCDCISCTLSALLCDIIDSVNAVTLVSCVIDTPYNAFAYKPIDRLGTPLRAPPII